MRIMKDESTTQQKILTNATRLFGLHGYSATSIRDIAKDSGVNLSMIAYHFGNKEGLYKAVLETQLNQVLCVIKELQKLPSATQRLKLYVDGVKIVIEQNPHFASLAIMEFNTPSKVGLELMRKYFSQFYDFIYEAIQDGIANNEFKNDTKIEHIIFLFVGTLSFYNIIFKHFRTHQNMPFQNKIDDNYLDDAFSIMLNGIANASN